MTITHLTHLHAAPGQAETLAALVVVGRDRMSDAEGCKSFEILRDDDDTDAFVFVQRWTSHQAHNAAFAERILQTGHLQQVVAALDQPIVQRSYQVVP
jgi:quinol monooxygenase YgiN